MQIDNGQFSLNNFNSNNNNTSLSYYSKIFSPIKPNQMKKQSNDKLLSIPSITEFSCQQQQITNSLHIKFPYQMTKDELLGVFLQYGEIENLSVNEKELEISYLNLNCCMKAYNEIKLNFEKLKNENIEENVENHPIIQYKTLNFFNKFYISINLSSMNPFILLSNLKCIIIIFKQMAKIQSIYQYNLNFNSINVLFQFQDERDKEIIDFMIKRWITKSQSDDNKFIINNNAINEIEFPNLSNYYVLYSFNKNEEFIQNLYYQSNMNSFNLNNNTNYYSNNTYNIYNNSFNINYSLSSNKENININNNNCNNNFSIEKEPIKIDIKVESFTGIKQRNIPVKDRKKYEISPENIINETDQRTTLMVKNIPKNISQKFLMKVFNMNYFDDYNFLYLPVDFTKKINVGYAFINFRNCKRIVQFYLDFNCKPWPFAKNMKCYLSYARIQGFRAIAQHFEKSDIMKQQNKDMKPFIQDD